MASVQDFVEYHLKQVEKASSLEKTIVELQNTLSRAQKEKESLETTIQNITTEKDIACEELEAKIQNITTERNAIFKALKAKMQDITTERNAIFKANKHLCVEINKLKADLGAIAAEKESQNDDKSELALWKQKFEEQEIELEKLRDVFRRVNEVNTPRTMTNSFHPDNICDITDMRVSSKDGVQEFKTYFPNRKRAYWVTIDQFMDSKDDTYTPLERFLCKKMDIELYMPDPPCNTKQATNNDFPPATMGKRMRLMPTDIREATRAT